MFLNVKDLVVVGGLSQKGKNRINEHGAVWSVKKIWDKEVLLESLENEIVRRTLRWVRIDDDPDFEILGKEVLD